MILSASLLLVIWVNLTSIFLWIERTKKMPRHMKFIPETEIYYSPGLMIPRSHEARTWNRLSKIPRIAKFRKSKYRKWRRRMKSNWNIIWPSGRLSLKLIFYFIFLWADSSFVPPLVYAVFGSSKHLAVGTVAACSLLIGSIIGQKVSPVDEPELYLHLVFTATFFTGILQAAMGFLR